MNKLDQAEKYYREALEAYIRINNRSGEGGIYHQLGVLAEGRKQWDQSRDFLLKALMIGVSEKLGECTETTLISLAKVWKTTGDNTILDVVAQIIGTTRVDAEELMTNYVLLLK